MIRYGRGRARLLLKHPDTFSLAGFVPAMFVTALGLLTLLSAWVTPILALLAVALAIYGLTLLTVSVGLAVKRRDWSLLGRLPFVFAAIHFGAGLGILRELMPVVLGRALRRLAKVNYR